MNLDDEVIKIVCGTIKKYQEKIEEPLEHYNGWKDEIIKKVQDYIKDNYNKK